MGDIVSLVEKATESIDMATSESTIKKFQQGYFDFNGLADQLRSLKKMGGLGKIMKFIPGMSNLLGVATQAQMPEKTVDRYLSIISSMTQEERSTPRILNASRKKRIAAGSGTSVQDINKLLKQFLQTEKLFRRLRTDKLDLNDLDPSNLKDLFS